MKTLPSTEFAKLKALPTSHQPRNPTTKGPIKTQIIPTYISTDLVTPGLQNRETLPGIG